MQTYAIETRLGAGSPVIAASVYAAANRASRAAARATGKDSWAIATLGDHAHCAWAEPCAEAEMVDVTGLIMAFGDTDNTYSITAAYAALDGGTENAGYPYCLREAARRGWDVYIKGEFSVRRASEPGLRSKNRQPPKWALPTIVGRGLVLFRLHEAVIIPNLTVTDDEFGLPDDEFWQVVCQRLQKESADPFEPADFWERRGQASSPVSKTFR